MCVHYCQSCKKEYSHQEFPTTLPNGTQIYDSCPYESAITLARRTRPDSTIVLLEETLICPTCYEERTRWTNDGVHKHSMREYLKKMEEKDRASRLTSQEIVHLQLEVENTFQLFVHEMNENAMAEFYNDCWKMMEAYRVRALTVRRLKVDYDIAKLSTATDEERAAFEEAKKRKATEKLERRGSTSGVRKSKTEKMVLSFARQMVSAGRDARAALRAASIAYGEGEFNDEQIERLVGQLEN